MRMNVLPVLLPKSMNSRGHVPDAIAESRAILSQLSSEFLREMVHFLELSRVKSVWLCKSAMVSPRSCPHPSSALAQARSLIRKPIPRDGNLPIWPATDSQRFAWIVPSHSKQGLPIHGCIHVASSTKSKGAGAPHAQPTGSLSRGCPGACAQPTITPRNAATDRRFLLALPPNPGR